MTSAAAEASSRLHSRLWLLLGVLLACRLVLLIWAPHTDPSEARYAEISRKMAETGDWITPQFDYGVPFWAKPPLSMWMSALGIELFGANEFGSRIVIFAGALGVLWLVARMGRKDRDATIGLAAAAILIGMPLFFYCSAAVMTDLALTMGTTLSMAGFRFAITENSRGWGYAFFVGLAIGLLAKGPLVLLLAGPPVLGWLLFTGRWRDAWQKIPWLTGTLLMLAIAVPWFVMEERKTPGFLDYFFIGEHWHRFTIPSWDGDLYGRAHAVLPGTVVLYWMAGMLPWCAGFLVLPLHRWRELGAWARAQESGGFYWLLWALWPIVIFLPVRNITATYPLPALPGSALLLATVAVGRIRSGSRNLHALHPILVTICGIIIAWALAVSLIWPDHAPKFSERDLVHRYQHDRRNGDHLLYYGGRKFSAEFYAEGNIDHTGSIQDIEEKLAAPGRLFLATPERYLPTLPAALQYRFSRVANWGPEILFVERTDIPVLYGIDPRVTPAIGQ